MHKVAGGYGRDISTTVAVHRQTLGLGLSAWQAWASRRTMEQSPARPTVPPSVPV